MTEDKRVEIALSQENASAEVSADGAWLYQGNESARYLTREELERLHNLSHEMYRDICPLTQYEADNIMWQIVQEWQYMALASIQSVEPEGYRITFRDTRDGQLSSVQTYGELRALQDALWQRSREG